MNPLPLLAEMVEVVMQENKAAVGFCCTVDAITLRLQETMENGPPPGSDEVSPSLQLQRFSETWQVGLWFPEQQRGRPSRAGWNWPRREAALRQQSLVGNNGVHHGLSC